MSAAPLLFGRDFEKSAKEHMESVRSIRKLQASSGTGGSRQQFFSERPPPPPCSGERRLLPREQQQQRRRKRALSSVSEGEPPAKVIRRSTDTSLEPQSQPIIVAPEIVYVYQNLPLVLSMLDLTQSGATRLLQSKGIAAEMTAQGFPLVGRTEHYLSNWQTITQDEWVLSVVKGYRIEFLQKPYQQRKSLQLTFTEECMQAEIQSMLDKQAISRS